MIWVWAALVAATLVLQVMLYVRLRWWRRELESEL